MKNIYVSVSYEITTITFNLVKNDTWWGTPKPEDNRQGCGDVEQCPLSIVYYWLYRNIETSLSLLLPVLVTS